MEDKTRALIVTGAVLLLILALIIAAIFYLIRFIQSRSTGVRPSPTPTTQVSTSPTVEGIDAEITDSPITPSGETKEYLGSGFQLNYPKNWGILTCNNSQNIEFDPYDGTDHLKVACDYAQKSVTVMYGVSCEGAVTQIGGVAVVKSSRMLSKGTEKSWCVKVGNGLFITNRVSTESARGYGKDDQTVLIEKMISEMRVGGGS